VDRTSSWDDFPNGRFGARESPAYGIFTKPPKPSEKMLQARREMWTIDGLKGLGEVFCNFLQPNTGVTSLPWCSECPGDETVCIRAQLCKLCRAGMLTINSQPRVNGSLSTDPLFGWGPSDGVVYQKAYVEFFCSPATLKVFEEQLSGQSTIEYMAVNMKGDMRKNTPDRSPHVTAVTWGVFTGQEIQQPTVVDIDSFLAWKDEAFALWTDWSDALGADKEESRKIIKSCQQEWYLVNAVDNNYLSSDLFVTLCEIAEGTRFAPTQR
jgi:methylenetetrahydrofolate reductase (NADPH)